MTKKLYKLDIATLMIQAKVSDKDTLLNAFRFSLETLNQQIEFGQNLIDSLDKIENHISKLKMR